MKNQKNEKQNQDYVVYVEGQPIPVTKEVYEECRRSVWSTYDFMRRHGRCKQADWRRCSGDCGGCAYQDNGDCLSFDHLCESPDFEFGVPCNDPADIIADKMLLENILMVADQIIPNGKRMVLLLLEGETTRSIADILGIPRSTCNERKMKLFQKLKEIF